MQQATTYSKGKKRENKNEEKYIFTVSDVDFEDSVFFKAELKFPF